MGLGEDNLLLRLVLYLTYSTTFSESSLAVSGNLARTSTPLSH
jgi:hypothetical protein